MRQFCIWLLLFASWNAYADETPAQELSGRSKMPLNEVNAMLNDCDASQQSMYFCAWRDQIVAERRLQQAIDSQVKEHPRQKAVIEEKIAKWKMRRDVGCNKTAHQNWGGGSMEPTARLTCQADETQSQAKSMRKKSKHSLSAAERSTDPIATRKALAVLLASSNAAIPNTSTCRGDYGQSGQPTIKDMLAMQLAYLYAGKNTIEGKCASGACSIIIRHAAGEDVASATIKFGIRKGRMNLATLRCTITP
jgi:uncharacterized protein YecT (DUF1311 family)